KDGYGVGAIGSTFEWSTGWRSLRKRTKIKRSNLELLKLHGSINWTLNKNNRVRLKPRPYAVRTKRGSPVFDKCSILPPGWQKRVDRNPYRELWRRARLRLEQCSSLAIIGYSLPDTDILAQALFAEVVRLRVVRGYGLRHLYLAEPSPK